MYILDPYVDGSGRVPFAIWVNTLDPIAAAKIATALDRMERGLLGDVKPVGNGVSERRLHFGPGYRIYFGTLGRNGAATLLVLLHGGTKRNQANDVKTAKAYWAIYRRRMREG